MTAHSRDRDCWSLVARVSPRFGVARFCVTLGCWSGQGQRRGVQLAPLVHCVAMHNRDRDCCSGGWRMWHASTDPTSHASARRRCVAQWRQRWWGVQRTPLLVVQWRTIADATVGRWLWCTSGDPVSRASAQPWGVAQMRGRWGAQGAPLVVILARDHDCSRSCWWAIVSGCSLAPVFCRVIGITNCVTRAVVAAWCDTWAVVGGFWAPLSVVGGAFTWPFGVAVRARLGDF